MTLDTPEAVRKGEELDLEALTGWLRRTFARHPSEAGERSVDEAGAGVELLQFRQGYSNLTYGVRFDRRDLVLRRPPTGSRVATAHDMGREFRILSRLWRVYPRAPRALAFCDDASVLGVPFYVMERISGVILRSRLSTGLALEPSTSRALGEAFIDALAELHRVDPAAAGLADLGRPEGYVERQVRGWGERWRAARIGGEGPELDRLAEWLSQRVPAATGCALVHNDFKLDNLVLDPEDLTRIRGVLDWEMATLGDPMLDLGTALGYWVEAGDAPELRALAFGPTALPGMPSRRQLAERYAARAGCTLTHLPFYYAFGLFKIAVIAQQIYVRYAQGLTRDPRFADLPSAIAALARAGAAVAEAGDV